VEVDNVDAKDIANDVTIEITVIRYKQWVIRYNIGLWLIKLASLVMWCNVEIIENEKGEI
jgi:hypothetical protein